MGKTEYSITEWKEFRNEILDLVNLYHHVKEYADFDTDKIKYIERFFHLSRKQAITSFFIKVGFLISNGTPTLKDFLSYDDYNELFRLYESKVKKICDLLYAHNLKSKLPLNYTLSNSDVEEMYAKIIATAKTIDQNFEEPYSYDFVLNADGIKSIESLIDRTIELKKLKDELIKSNFKAKVELGIYDGKIKIDSDSEYYY